MQLFPRGRGWWRLSIIPLFWAGVYVWLWWCTRAFWLPAPGKPGGDLVALEKRLRSSVSRLAGLGERNSFHPARLADAEAWISSEWKAQGLNVRRRSFVARGQNFHNLEVSVAGTGTEAIVFVGAHYDTANGPGADDNASGIAALLEITRALRGTPAARRLRCVAFTNEEPPFFDTPDMGSRRYAKGVLASGENIALMISLETIAYFDDRPGSQRYPFGLGHFYTPVGNFIGVVGNVASRSLVRDAASALAAATDVPVACGALPGKLPGVYWSDHSSFWEIGVPAVMITDTAPFRNPHYHEASDRPETLDFPRFTRVTAGLIAMVRTLLR